MVGVVSLLRYPLVMYSLPLCHSVFFRLLFSGPPGFSVLTSSMFSFHAVRSSLNEMPGHEVVSCQFDLSSGFDVFAHLYTLPFVE